MTFRPGCNKTVTIVIAWVHKLSFVELRSSEESGISLHVCSGFILGHCVQHRLARVCRTAHTNPGTAITFSRTINSAGKGSQATTEHLLMVMSILLPWQRFVIGLKIPQTVLTLLSHKFTTPRTPVRMSGDKKRQSYFLIWSSLLYSTSALRYTSGYTPREKVPANFMNSFQNTQ